MRKLYEKTFLRRWQKIFVCSYLYNDHLIVGLYHIDLVKAFSGCLTIDVFVIARLCGWFALLQHAAGNTMVSETFFTAAGCIC